MSNRKSQLKNLISSLNNTDITLSHYLEFGVWKGKSLSLIKKHTSELDDVAASGLFEHVGLNYVHGFAKVYGFDSFVGLPEDWVSTCGALREIVAKKHHFNLNSIHPRVEGVTFFKGFFEQTIPEYKEEGQPICFLHIDCDLYSSTKTVLCGLNDLIVTNTIIVFDEWHYRHNKKYNDGEQKAFYEWAKKYNRKYEFLNFLSEKDSSGDVEQKTVRIIK